MNSRRFSYSNTTLTTPDFWVDVATYSLENFLVTVCDSDDYRFGFNGMEKDNELKGVGNSLEYKFRMHDSRLGSFFALDPLSEKFPWNSTYAFCENSPIYGFELEGLEMTSYEHYLIEKYKKVGIPNSEYIRQRKLEGLGMFIVLSTAYTFGNPEVAATAFRMGLAGATIGATFTASTGGNGRDIIKSSISRFFGGAMLALPENTFAIGAYSGLVSEATNQMMDISSDEIEQVNSINLLTASGIGVFADFLGGKLVGSVENAISKKLSEIMASLNSKGHFKEIKTMLKKQLEGGNRKAIKQKLNSAVYRYISSEVETAKWEANALKVMATKMIENTVDMAQNVANEKAK